MTQTKNDFEGEANERLHNALSQLKQARVVQQVFVGLGKELSLGTSQEEFLKLIVDTLQALFGGAYHLIQLTDPKTLSSIVVESAGPLRPGAANTIHLTHSAVRKTGLDMAMTQSALVEVVEKATCLFEGSAYALHVPLVSDNQLYGAIQIESQANNPLGDDDEVLLISLANQIALALRNQHLFEETAFLKNYLESVLEHANALIVVTDRNRQILVYNRAMEELLCFSKEETLARDLFSWIPKEEQAAMAHEISEALAGRAATVGFETRMRNRDGDLIHILFHFSALRDRHGELGSLILVGQDMTQLRSLEIQIIEAEKMASLGKLAAGVVHELNNPLTSISVYADYLVKKLATGRVDPNDVTKASKIVEGANRIQKLTRDLVLYGRPSNEDPQRLALNDVVAQGLSFCEHTIRKHDVVATSELARDLPTLLGNCNQLVQVIINLVTNACQAMTEGGQLVVGTHLESAERVCLSVADTGIGISAKNLERIFEPFFTTKLNGQGTGLGLSIVKRIVEHHKGEIRVRSVPQAGTTFELFLPVEGPNGKKGRQPCEPGDEEWTDPGRQRTR